MKPAQVEAAKRALFSVQIVSIILKALGDGETAVDPAAIEWLGERLGEAYEEVERAFYEPGVGGSA